MSGVVKQVAADAASVRADAEAAVKAAGVATAAAEADVAAARKTAGADVGKAQGWLRRNVWGVLGVAVVLALLAAWLVAR
jgi:hypothetical protein